MMTIEDIGKVVDLLEFNYGAALFKDKSREEIVLYWEMMLRDENPEMVAYAIKDCFKTLQYPPRIADILQRIDKVKRLKVMTEMEAFQRIKQAVDEAGSREDTQKAFDRLPPTLQKVVVKAGQLKDWRLVSPEFFETTIMRQIMRSYNQVIEREEVFDALPEGVQSDLLQLQAPDEPEEQKPVLWEKEPWEIMKEKGEMPVLNEKQQGLYEKFFEPVPERKQKSEKAVEERAEGFASVSDIAKSMLANMMGLAQS